MPKYTSQLLSNGNIKVRDFTSLQELPRIFVNVTKAIGMFVDIWLGTRLVSIDRRFDRFDLSIGKEIDPSCLYSPKPASNPMALNENIPSTPTNNLSSRPTAQSLRGLPSALQPTPPAMPGTMKTTRSQMDNRKCIFLSFLAIVHSLFFSLVSVSIPSNPSATPLIPSSSASTSQRPERIATKLTRLHRPTVNSLIHLYGPWIFDCCLLQLKDRSARPSSSVNTNDRKSIKALCQHVKRGIEASIVS